MRGGRRGTRSRVQNLAHSVASSLESPPRTPGEGRGRSFRRQGRGILWIASMRRTAAPTRRDWGRAMEAELAHVHGRSARWWFAVGGARVALFPPRRSAVPVIAVAAFAMIERATTKLREKLPNRIARSCRSIVDVGWARVEERTRSTTVQTAGSGEELGPTTLPCSMCRVGSARVGWREPSRHDHCAAAPQGHFVGAPHLHFAGAPHLHFAGAPHLHFAGAPHLHFAGAPHLHFAGAPHKHFAGASHRTKVGAGQCSPGECSPGECSRREVRDGRGERIRTSDLFHPKEAR